MVTLGKTMVALVTEEVGPLRYASRFQRRAAGAESNVAIGLARLGVSAGWVSRVGDDEFGRYVCVARGEVPVVDEVGAGDAFAAYLAATFRRIPIDNALRIANAAGALATIVPGDVEDLADWGELEQFALHPEGAVQR